MQLPVADFGASLSHLFCSYNQNHTLIIITLWALWLSHNKLIHEKRRQTVHDLSSFVLGYEQQLRMVDAPSQRQRPDDNPSWCPPEHT